MIGRQERAQWSRRLGVTHQQVARDHLVSCILHWLASSDLAHECAFIGGTALARSHLLDARVSEDVDLLTSVPADAAARIRADLPAALRREYPGLQVLHAGRGPRGPVIHAESPDGQAVQIQILTTEPAVARLPTRPTPVALRYARLPATVDLTLPTPAAFVAMKVAAYRDRAEPRDLFDLAELARRGHVTTDALTLTRQLTNATPRTTEFATVPERVQARWHDRLAHQLTDPGTPTQAARAIAQALQDVLPNREPD